MSAHLGEGEYSLFCFGVSEYILVLVLIQEQNMEKNNYNLQFFDSIIDYSFICLEFLTVENYESIIGKMTRTCFGLTESKITNI